MARSVYAMARAVRARAWPCSRVLADRRERDRVQLRVCNMICAKAALICKAGSILCHMVRGVRVRRVRLNQ